MTGFDVDAFLDSYQSRVEEVRIGIDPALTAEHGRLNTELRDAMLKGDEGWARELAAQVADVEARSAESGKLFRFQAVTAKEWADLMAANPPTDEQLAKNKLLDHNPDTFPIAAIAASSLEPKLTENQVARARKTLGNADFHTLWETVYLVNKEVMITPKSPLAGAVLQANDGSSATPPRKASRGRSSSAGNGARPRRTTTTTPAA